VVSHVWDLHEAAECGYGLGDYKSTLAAEADLIKDLRAALRIAQEMSARG
jgi:hypothetical protein